MTEPEAVFARIIHSTQAGRDQRVRLAQVAPGVYEGALERLAPGRWRVILEDPMGEWRVVKEGL